MRKFVFFLSIDEPIKSFEPTNLSKVSRHPAERQLVRYIDERIIDASLEKIADYASLRQLELTCKYRGRRTTGKLPIRPTIKQKSDLWICEGKKLALAVDLPLDLSPIAATLLSDGLWGKLGLVRNLHLGRREFMKLREAIRRAGGKLDSFHLLDTRRPAPLRTLQASGPVESFPGFFEALETSRIKRLGFHVELGNERFSFWIANLGNGTLYLPSNPQPHHIRKFLEFIESALDVE